jgi:thiol-disulfide isomerase/thioredoxin
VKKTVIVVVVIGIAAALGILAQRHFASGPAAEPAPTATASLVPDSNAVSPPPAADAAPAKAIPEVLPHVELTDRDGKKRSLADWKGRPLMVNFWATWCGPCRREIPLLNQLRKEHQAQKLEIVGIAVDFRDDVLAYVKDNPISYPLLIGEEDGLAAVEAMGVAQAAFPFTVFADSQQRILTLKLGELHADEADLILGRLADVDAGKLPLPEARKQITEGLKELATRRAAANAATG